MMKETSASALPLVIAGPILRKATASQLVLWFVTTERLDATFYLYQQGESEPCYQAVIADEHQIQIGEKAWVVLAQFEGLFPVNTPLSYQLVTQHGLLTELIPSLTYQNESAISFVINTKADYVLHGSCRNPHYPSKDSLVAADNKVEGLDILERPSLLMMSGDQIYADHVAGPTLDAIEQVVQLLGLPKETFEQASIADTDALYRHPHHLYGREKLLPTYIDQTWLGKLIPNRTVPIFSSRECENHLISFSEYFVMYLLVWSPTLWQYVDRERFAKQHFICGGEQVALKWRQQWEKESVIMDDFIQGLPQVQRLFAHIPTYMIFDDHDITDDYQLNRRWEKAAFDNLFSRRIIGNALISYWLCQAWGNAPEKFESAFIDDARRYFAMPCNETQDTFIARLNQFEQWHYTIPTTPKMVVLDTRTRRWRSESNDNRPSGLMDWEAMTEFQQELLNEPAVIIVSAAPMFGVKFIETLQRMMTWIGQPLLVDAENWMAHPGSANTLLSIFTHTKTPTNFIILSGDVHYSFAYDITLRNHKGKFHIYQITCSGFKNEFPNRLLRFCDAMDRALYSPHSPLNWFTKRKELLIEKRDPDVTGSHRLVNRSAIGELYLTDDGVPKKIDILTAEGELINFPAQK
ncbi:alkaline phosphatase D family protein [Photobacterium lucens]|uniref:alkaline phosphatase D family protein n=1 Tax=Photobacterium lucens TaxID=2562949 RepID=UPI00136F4DC6|nr:alkaline phosphatase D family protein [Photobacterium lucens]MBP2701328.1 alkaline phosphatase family protein [Vibrio parahaemolyticus]MZG57908.1 alkaline phosphatase family protein [Photobacterium lucens]MZG80591.1 alkaline phosphatase family protein [Photobacterium lucens]